MILLALRFVLCSIKTLTLVILGFVPNFYLWSGVDRFCSHTVSCSSSQEPFRHLGAACVGPALLFPLGLYIRSGFPHSSIGKESLAVQETLV